MLDKDWSKLLASMYQTPEQQRTKEYEIYRLIFNNAGDVLRDRQMDKVPGYASKKPSYEGLPGSFDEIRDRLFAFERPMFEAMVRLWNTDDGKLVDDGRFRVNGYVELEGPRFRHHIDLTTEFTGWVDDNDFWIELYTLAKKLGVFVQDWGGERECVDKRWSGPKNASPAQIAEFHRSNDSYNAKYGPDHGRLQRQVALVKVFSPEEATPEAIQTIRSLWEKETQAVWDKAGVCVC